MKNTPIPFDVEQIRQDFPILKQTIHGKPLIYLDNAATAQKPQMVIDTINHYYQQDNANIHRAVHYLSEQATQQYESSRHAIRRFINAQSTNEIIFVRGATEGINLIANTFGKQFLTAGDEIIISEMEHHANIVPWQILRDQTGIQIKVIPLLESGELNQNTYRTLFSSKTKLVSIIHASNAIGTVNPIKSMIETAHQYNVPVLVDAAQSIVHGTVDVQDLDCDFLVFSGHKLYGPTGIGILYGKSKWLTQLPPFQGGGEMIEHVTLDQTTYAEPPHKFEAGTPNIAGAIGLASAIEYLQRIGLNHINVYEKSLLEYALSQLNAIDGLTILANGATNKVPIITFTINGIHALDVATLLDGFGIAVRSGHHCAMPTLQHYDVSACTRVSLAFYNTFAEIDALAEALYKIKQMCT